MIDNSNQPILQKIEPAIFRFSGIKPIGSVAEGLLLGDYHGFCQQSDPYITDQTTPLQSAVEPKDLFVISFDCRLGDIEYVERLKELGKQPCAYAPNYLLGLMANVKEEDMPQEIKGRDVAGIEQNSRSIFPYRNGRLCFLYVCRSGGPCSGSRAGKGRVLNLATLEGRFHRSWLFLAEDIIS